MTQQCQHWHSRLEVDCSSSKVVHLSSGSFISVFQQRIHFVLQVFLKDKFETLCDTMFQVMLSLKQYKEAETQLLSLVSYEEPNFDACMEALEQLLEENAWADGVRCATDPGL